MSLEGDLDRLVRSHAGEGVGLGIDDMEIDLFRRSRHDEGKGVAQISLFSVVADKYLKFRVGPDIRRHRCSLPGRYLRPDANRPVAIKSFGNLIATIGSDPTHDRQPLTH